MANTRTSQGNSPKVHLEDRSSKPTINVGQNERTLSVFSGLALILLGIKGGGIKGMLSILWGGNMLYRGATGYCWVNNALGINTAVGSGKKAVSVPHQQGIRVQERVTIQRPVEEVYAFWRNFENLPRFMDNLESVQVLNGQESRWVAKGPVGSQVAWNARIINERPNELIAWQSTEGAQVANAGSVTFRPTANGQGTEVQVTMEYTPPAGQVGAFVAKLLGREPQQQIPEDMQRLKQVLESQEVPARLATNTMDYSVS